MTDRPDPEPPPDDVLPDEAVPKAPLPTQVLPTEAAPNGPLPNQVLPNDAPPPQLSPSDLRLQAFGEKALPRIFRILLIISLLSLVPAWSRYGWVGAVGFAAGALVSGLNFRALQRSVEALADRIVNLHSQEKGRRIVFRFLLRYALVATVAYAIFNSSALAFRGFLVGLCLPVAAMMIEAALEAFMAFRRD
jgi:hypothetical protein